MFKLMAKNFNISISDSLYLLFISLDLGAFDLVSCYATCYFIDSLTLNVQIMEVLGSSEWCYFPPERMNFVSGRQLGWGKITSIQLVMEQMGSWVTNFVRADLFPVTPQLEI